MRGALAQNRAVSKRDIYYQDPALFGRQAVVDRYIDDLAFTFRVPRNVLNVSAAAKGLVVGRLRVIRAREDDFQVAHSGEVSWVRVRNPTLLGLIEEGNVDT